MINARPMVSSFNLDSDDENSCEDAWTNNPSDMGIDVGAVKSRITSLLSSYRREEGKIKKSTGTGKEPTSDQQSKEEVLQNLDLASNVNQPMGSVDPQSNESTTSN
ncbi:hypothetical protein JTB14_029363 [Gonioctena quinquepunctata]|nr:hypothetical protein JTB14_029363 [Gonioctena quinquepunctata]